MDTKRFSFLFSLFFAVSAANINHIDFIANPNCTETQMCQDPWVIHGRRQFNEESTHYLYGAIDKPTFLMGSGSINSSLNINWTAVQQREARSINLTSIHNLFGFSIQNIIFFNDRNDTGTINNVPSNQKLIVPTSDFKWRFSYSEKSNSTNYPIYFSSNEFRGMQLAENAGISINLTAYLQNGRAQNLPHLLVYENSTLIDISLKDLVTALNETSLTSIISTFTHPRCALDFIIFGTNVTNSFSATSSKSLDDEYTPGIFNIDDIVSEAKSENRVGFMQWRPVAYLTKDRNINFSTRPNFNRTMSPVDHTHLSGSKNSLLYYLFGNDIDSFSATQTIITFGRSNDGYYTAYNYTLWSFSFGLGYPPREGFSIALIITICISIGLPLILLVLGFLYFIITKRRETYQQL